MSKVKTAWRWFVVVYRGLALFLLNALVLLLVAVALLPPAVRWVSGQRGRLHGPRRQGVQAAYPHRTPAEVDALLQETWTRPLEYAPWVQFKEREHHGRYVNVSAHGFRHVKDQGPWPPSPELTNVFVFGGSTTFGYGIADDETVASALQEALAGRTARPVRVYNFGCAHYYSSQERILFQQLLVGGFVPQLAVFIDGLNDFHQRTEEPPRFGPEFHAYVERRAVLRSRGPSWRDLLPWWAVGRSRSPGDGGSRDPVVADRLIERYLNNKKMTEALARTFGVQPVFVWQPITMYKFDWNRHPLGRSHPQALPGVGAERMAVRWERENLGPDFIWAADIHDQIPDPLYVDGVHYAPNLCRSLARFIVDTLSARGRLR